MADHATPAASDDGAVPDDDPYSPDAAHPRGLGAREGDDLRELAEAYDEHDRDAVTRAARRLGSDAWDELFGPTSFVPVFLLAMLTIVLVSLATSRGIIRIATVLLGVTMLWTALARARLRTRVRHLLRVLVAVALGGSILTNLLGLTDINPTLLTAFDVIDAALLVFVLLVTMVVCLRELLHHEAISLSAVAAAMSAYLMIGLFFSSLMGIVASIQGAAFFNQGVQPTASDLTYFSFITLTTVGYGDLSPGTSAGRALVVAEAITGQIFLVTIVARVVSAYGTRRQGVRPPDEPTPAQLRAQRRAERRQALDRSAGTRSTDDPSSDDS
ncbi:MAG: ion channel [Acidimicrobiales bacterium]